MPYPAIPLELFYNVGIDFDSRPTNVELGKGGVIGRSKKHWLNATKRTFNISATLTERAELKTFLETNRGLPFEFRSAGVNPPGLFVCKTWTWKHIVYAEGNGVWGLTAKFEEIFRPGSIPPSSVTESRTTENGNIRETETGNMRTTENQ
jgi:hypothetical protein